MVKTEKQFSVDSDYSYRVDCPSNMDGHIWLVDISPNLNIWICWMGKNRGFRLHRIGILIQKYWDIKVHFFPLFSRNHCRKQIVMTFPHLTVNVSSATSKNMSLLFINSPCFRQ